jgi:hypothetical protein
MGYMGLDHWVASDTASDLVANFQAVARKAIKEKQTRYNTSGAVNVALLLEGGVLGPNFLDEELKDQLLKALAEEIKTAKDKKHWDSEEGRLEHLQAFQRLHKFVKKLKAEA